MDEVIGHPHVEFPEEDTLQVFKDDYRMLHPCKRCHQKVETTMARLTTGGAPETDVFFGSQGEISVGMIRPAGKDGDNRAQSSNNQEQTRPTPQGSSGIVSFVSTGR